MGKELLSVDFVSKLICDLVYFVFNCRAIYYWSMITVYSVENKTNRVVAIKIIDLEDADDEIEDVQQEITVLSQCDSRFVTTYYGAYLKVGQINF